MKEIICASEIIAYNLLYRSWVSNMTAQDYHNAGDEIILLAEKIKAERMTIAMSK